MLLKLSFKSFYFLIFLVVFIQCEIEEANAEIRKKENLKFSHNVLENGRIISKPVEQPLPVDQKYTIQLQHDENGDNKQNYIVQGDILIPKDEVEHAGAKRIKRKILAETNGYGTSNRWPRAVIPYDFISGIDYRVRQNVLAAMQHWHQHTCIRFEQYDSQRHSDINAKITIEDTGSGCATFVGYRPDSNGYLSSYAVYLPLQCPLGSAIHELGHVIGFYHEMARTDRNQEIVLYFNLMSGSEATQYDVMPNPMPGYYGQPYDLGSVMHYYPTNVMTARDSRHGFLMGQRDGLSFLDSKLANLGYHCAANCQSAPVCLNEGYINQNCQCTCPDGFYGTRCHLLQGYLSTDGSAPLTPQTTTRQPMKKTTTEAPTTSGVYWLEWSEWSDCSESCGSGIRVRTRLCSSTIIEGSTNPCSSLGGDSFEIELCQDPSCNQNDILLTCTFDFGNEKCPLKNQDQSKIQSGKQADQSRPITDHTRGDGKYFLLDGNKDRSNALQTFHLGPFKHSDALNNNGHCLKFWYTIRGQVVGKVTIQNNLVNNETFTFDGKDQDSSWKQIQHTIPNNGDYEVIFDYEASPTEYYYIAIDDISIINGPCTPKKTNIQERRKRRQASSRCSSVIDLTMENARATITSPNYPSSYPTSAQCYYYIRAPPSYHVTLQFSDFNIPSSYSNSCGDSVEVRYYNLGQPGPVYCGSGANTNNLQFVSTKNYIMIIFQSDQSYAGRGFSAQASLSS